MQIIEDKKFKLQFRQLKLLPILSVVLLLTITALIAIATYNMKSTDNRIKAAERITTTFQPSVPYHATFYYPWYKTQTQDGSWSYWNDPNSQSQAHSPPANWFSNYLPDLYPNVFDSSMELYSSNDDAVIYWQLRKLAEARIEVAISSWWGQGHKTDTAFNHIITDVMNRQNNPYPNLRWAFYYEKEGFSNPPVSEIVSDLNYLKDHYSNQGGMLKINDKIVVFVYGDVNDGADMASRWKQAKDQVPGVYIDLKVFNGFQSDPNQPDSWHQYAPANRTDTQGGYYYAVSPGFWLDNDPVRLPRDTIAFTTAVQSLVASTVPWKLIETWNEWGEGTSVEPGVQVIQTTSGQATLDPNGVPFQNRYIDILKNNLPQLENGTGQVTYTLAAAGDIACGSDTVNGACQQMATANTIIKMAPDGVLALGDTQYEQGQLSNFQNYYDSSWGRFFTNTYPVVGNHEYLTSGAAGYFDYFNGIGQQSGKAGDRDKGYYAFNIGSNWRVYVINSNCSQAGGCGNGSAQETWLRNDLNANPGKCQIMAMHHPYVSSDDRNFNYYTEQRTLWDDFYNAGGELVLTGHSHFYERYKRMNPDRNYDTRGIRFIIAGIGGKNVYGFTNRKPLSDVSFVDIFGGLKLTLNPTSYRWDLMSTTSSNPLDSGIGYCYTGTPDTEPPSAPSNLQGTSSYANQVDLSWNAATDNVGVESYVVYRNNTAIATLTATSLTYSDFDTQPNTTYQYYVKALDPNDNPSQPSNTITITTASTTVYGSDTFTRTASNGWGSADTGGSYSLTGTSSNFNINGSEGTMLVTTAGSTGQNKALLSSLNAIDTDITVKVKTDKVAAGSGEYTYLLGRNVGTSTQYRGRVIFNPTGSVQLQAATLISGTEKFLGSAVTVSGLTHTANTYIRIRMQLLGTNPTTIKMKAWLDGTAEPTTWQYTVTDSTATLQTAGSAGLLVRLSTTATNAPVLYTFDDLQIINPTGPSPTQVQATPTNAPSPTNTPTPIPTSTPFPTVPPTVSPTPVDTIPPTVSITSPGNGAYVTRNTTVRINVNAADNVGVTKVEFYINNAIKFTDTTSPYFYDWRVPGKSGVRYTITAKAFDAANNMSSASITVTSR